MLKILSRAVEAKIGA